MFDKEPFMLHRARQRPPKPTATWKGPKPKLPMSVALTCRVHYQDLADYLAQTLKMRDYDVLLAAGATKGMCPEYRVNGVLGIASNIQQQANNVRQGRRTRNLGLILNVLCLDEFIPKGLYVIDTHQRPGPIQEYTQLLNETRDPKHTKCVAFKKKHQKDKVLMERAHTLDIAVRRFQQGETNGNQ